MVATAGKFFMVVGVGAFIAALATTFWAANSVSSAETKESVDAAVRTVSYTAGALIAILTLVSYMYVQADPSAEKAYIFIMLHASLFLSLLGVSIAVLTKRTA